MFSKHTIYPRGGFNANRVHEMGQNKDDKDYHIKGNINIALARLGERRMFDEWAIEGRADNRYGNNKSQDTNTSRKFGSIING